MLQDQTLCVLEDGIELVTSPSVALSWGWDVDAANRVECLQSGQKWSGHTRDVRLAKIIRSLWLFEEYDYFHSMQKFALELLKAEKKTSADFHLPEHLPRRNSSHAASSLMATNPSNPSYPFPSLPIHQSVGKFCYSAILAPIRIESVVNENWILCGIFSRFIVEFVCMFLRG